MYVSRVLHVCLYICLCARIRSFFLRFFYIFCFFCSYYVTCVCKYNVSRWLSPLVVRSFPSRSIYLALPLSLSHSLSLFLSVSFDRQLEWWRKTSRTLAHPLTLSHPIPYSVIFCSERALKFSLLVSFLRSCISRLARIFRSCPADYILKWSRKEKNNIITVGSRLERKRVLQQYVTRLRRWSIDRSVARLRDDDVHWELRASELSGSWYIFRVFFVRRWTPEDDDLPLPPF